MSDIMSGAAQEANQMSAEADAPVASPLEPPLDSGKLSLLQQPMSNQRNRLALRPVLDLLAFSWHVAEQNGSI